MTPEEELAWLAGLIEGEGSFQLIKNWVNSKRGRKCYRYPQIVIGMTDRDIIERVATIFGNSVCNLKPSAPGYKPQYSTQISGERAVPFIKKLRPFMGQRRQGQIDKALAGWDERPSKSQSTRATMKIVAASRKKGPDGRFLPNKR